MYCLLIQPYAKHAGNYCNKHSPVSVNATQIIHVIQHKQIK